MSQTTFAEPAPIETEKPAPRFRFDNRYLVPMLVTLILLGGHASLGILESAWKTGLAIITAILAEVVLSRLLLGRWPDKLVSAYISGISVGILIRSPFFWPYALTSLTTITSKYAIRYRGKHLFNPSNFGVSTTLFLAPLTVVSLSHQWGNTLWIMLPIWAVGLFVIGRLKRLHVSLTYLAAFLFYAFLRSQITGDAFLAEVAPITGPMYQLFVLFMITDPATTVSTRRGRMVVAFLVATVEFFLRLAGQVHAPYYALFLVGPTALFIELWLKGRGERAVADPVTEASSEALAAPSA